MKGWAKKRLFSPKGWAKKRLKIVGLLNNNVVDSIEIIFCYSLELLHPRPFETHLVRSDRKHLFELVSSHILERYMSSKLIPVNPMPAWLAG
jgi:hypothetical protein